MWVPMDLAALLYGTFYTQASKPTEQFQRHKKYLHNFKHYNSLFNTNFLY